MDLSGEWAFELDPDDRGIAEAWFDRPLSGRIHLPGSLQAQGFGDDIAVDTQWVGDIHYQEWFTAERFAPYRRPGAVKVPFWLQPKKRYTGVAWYQSEVDVPSGWADQRVTLTLERAHWETRLWLDDRPIGVNQSLSTPHDYDLGTGLPSGKHRLTIRVDNRLIVNVGPNAHSVSDHTQTNWNGIAGAIELAAGSPVWIDNTQVYPDVAQRSVALRITLGNHLAQAGQGWLTFQARSNSDCPHEPLAASTPVQIAHGGGVIEALYALGPDAQTWDEFNPVLYALDIVFDAEIEGKRHTDRREVVFGLREIGVEGTRITINGRETFLRGTLECCVFPLTGYPPADADSWRRIIRVCQAHGLNHIRFHSWCPPEAAFAAADELGFYYQVECGAWARLGEDEALDIWLYDEGRRITAAYGNHPSFIMMAYGNEPAGRMEEYLTRWVNYWKQHDPRRLHTGGTGWPILRDSQFHVTPRPRIQAWGEELRSRINARPPETCADYRDFVHELDKPVIGHEIGQWCAYPNFEEIAKYTGFLKPTNFEIFRDLLRAHHMGDQAHDFLIASGKLQVLCYKEDIEASLRTPGLGGFQLLGLSDFPGQGTALVGVLDAFWDSKGYVTADDYRRFCGETVLLARMSKRYWRTSEVFRADMEIAHFGPVPLEHLTAQWALLDHSGAAVAEGVLPPATIPIGNGKRLGTAQVNLAGLTPGHQYRLVAGCPERSWENDWDLWVFADRLDTQAPDSILVSECLDAQALHRLAAGGTVLLMPPAQDINTDCRVGFSSVFWNTAWTGNQAPHTLGILCDHQHPIFARFPTEDYSNWQWWELIHGSAAMVLDHLPPDLRPLVQPIDTWFENRRLGLLFEARVNNGKLMVCSMDLRSDLEHRLVARQMRHSVLHYMQSPYFDPPMAVEVTAIETLFHKRA